MRKVYAYASVQTDDKELIEIHKSLTANKLLNDTEMFKKEVSDLCERVRTDLGIKKVISFFGDEESKVLTVLIYDVESTTGTTFTQDFDDMGPYIVLDDQRVSS